MLTCNSQSKLWIPKATSRLLQLAGVEGTCNLRVTADVNLPFYCNWFCLGLYNVVTCCKKRAPLFNTDVKSKPNPVMTWSYAFFRALSQHMYFEIWLVHCIVFACPLWLIRVITNSLLKTAPTREFYKWGRKKNSATLCGKFSAKKKIRSFDWRKPGLIKGVLWQQIVSMDQQGIVNDTFRKFKSAKWFWKIRLVSIWSQTIAKRVVSM